MSDFLLSQCLYKHGFLNKEHTSPKASSTSHFVAKTKNCDIISSNKGYKSSTSPRHLTGQLNDEAIKQHPALSNYHSVVQTRMNSNSSLQPTIKAHSQPAKTRCHWTHTHFKRCAHNAEILVKCLTALQGYKCSCVVSLAQPSHNTDTSNQCPMCNKHVKIYSGAGEGPDSHIAGYDRFGVN
jgi:hypothetical protein